MLKQEIHQFFKGQMVFRMSGLLGFTIIIMEVENDLVAKETSLGRTPFPLPLEEGYSHRVAQNNIEPEIKLGKIALFWDLSGCRSRVRGDSRTLETLPPWVGSRQLCGSQMWSYMFFVTCRSKKRDNPDLFQLGGVASRMVQLKAMAMAFATPLTMWEINVTV